MCYTTRATTGNNFSFLFFGDFSKCVFASSPITIARSEHAKFLSKQLVYRFDQRIGFDVLFNASKGATVVTKMLVQTGGTKLSSEPTL